MKLFEVDGKDLHSEQKEAPYLNVTLWTFLAGFNVRPLLEETILLIMWLYVTEINTFMILAMFSCQLLLKTRHISANWDLMA
jgi:hypothetical protein